MAADRAELIEAVVDINECQLVEAVKYQLIEGSIADLSESDLQNLWSAIVQNLMKKLVPLVPPMSAEDLDVSTCEITPSQDVRDQLEAKKFIIGVSLLCKETAEQAEPNITANVFTAVSFLHGLIIHPAFDNEVQLNCVNLCDLWWKKGLYLKESVCCNVLFYLLKKSLLLTGLKSDIHRLFRLRDAFKVIDMSTDIAKLIIRLLVKALIHPKYLENKDGCKLLGHIMAINENLMKTFHAVVKKNLKNCKHTESIGYAEIYYICFMQCSDELRKVFEEHCLQDLMESIFLMPRRGLGMEIEGQKVFVILRHFHANQNIHLKCVLTKLYEPLLWRYLKDPSNSRRCNAVQVFFDVYPLEEIGKGRQSNQEFIEYQNKIMVDLLTDKCHIIRILATRGACSVLSEYWEGILPETIQKLISVMVKELVNDASSAEVRKSVFVGMKDLVKNPSSMEYLKTVLPQLKDHLHDVSSQVRRAFVELIIAIKAGGKVPFWEMVPLEHLVCRLSMESATVGKPLANLLFDCFFVPHKGVESMFKRLMRLVLMNRNAPRKLFLFSKQLIDFKTASKLIMHIISYMMNYIDNQLHSASGSSTSTRQASKTSKRTKGKENTSYSGNLLDRSKDDGVNIYSEHNLNNPHIAQSFLDIAIIVWLLHSEALTNPDNEKVLHDIYALCERCVPEFIKYYANTEAYTSILSLSGLLPSTCMKAMRQAYNLEDSCWSKVKSMGDAMTYDMLISHLAPLVMWNYGDKIFEQVRCWLDSVFKSQEDSIPVKERRVKFTNLPEPNPGLALRIINAVFTHSTCKSKILTKHKQLVTDLWKYLDSNIKRVFVQRVSEGNCLANPYLSDFILEEILLTFCKLITVVPFDDDNEVREKHVLSTFLDFLEWAEQNLESHLPDYLPTADDNNSTAVATDSSVQVPFVVNCFNCILERCSHFIGGTYPVDHWFIIKVAKLLKRLLLKECSLMMIQTICSVLKEIVDFSDIQYGRRDEINIFRLVVINLFKLVIEALSKEDMETFSIYCKNFADVSKPLAAIMMKCKSYYGAKSQHFRNLMNCIIKETLKSVASDSKLLEMYMTLRSMQDLPFLANQFLSVLTSIEPLKKAFSNRLKEYIEETKDIDVVASELVLLLVLAYDPKKWPAAVIQPLLTTAGTVVNTIKIPAESKSLDHMFQSCCDILQLVETCISNGEAGPAKKLTRGAGNNEEGNNEVQEENGIAESEPAGSKNTRNKRKRQQKKH